MKTLPLLMLLVGCMPTLTTVYRTPTSVDPTPQDLPPLNVEYEILGAVTGKACGNIQDYLLTGRGSVVGLLPGIYEAARYKALETMPSADNLMYVRVMSENDGYDQCVTVTGRAYRVRRMAAGVDVHGVPAPPPVGAPPVTTAPPPASAPAAPVTPSAPQTSVGGSVTPAPK